MTLTSEQVLKIMAHQLSTSYRWHSLSKFDLRCMPTHLPTQCSLFAAVSVPRRLFRETSAGQFCRSNPADLPTRQQTIPAGLQPPELPEGLASMLTSGGHSTTSDARRSAAQGRKSVAVPRARGERQAGSAARPGSKPRAASKAAQHTARQHQPAGAGYATLAGVWADKEMHRHAGKRTGAQDACSPARADSVDRPEQRAAHSDAGCASGTESDCVGQSRAPTRRRRQKHRCLAELSSDSEIDQPALFGTAAANAAGEDFPVQRKQPASLPALPEQSTSGAGSGTDMCNDEAQSPLQQQVPKQHHGGGALQAQAGSSSALQAGAAADEAGDAVHDSQENASVPATSAPVNAAAQKGAVQDARCSSGEKRPLQAATSLQNTQRLRLSDD